MGREKKKAKGAAHICMPSFAGKTNKAASQCNKEEKQRPCI